MTYSACALAPPLTEKAPETARNAARAAVPASLVGNQARLRRLAAAPAPLQAKLAIGAVDDPLEHEADAVADRVMRMPAPPADLSPARPMLSRKCAACEDDREVHPLQRQADGGGPASDAAPSLVHEVLRAPGRPLDPAARDFMADRFGADFADVRIHADAQAARSAAEVGARAYTVGRDIVFGAGQFDAVGEDGRRLLAHELAHVVQQSGGVAAKVQRNVPPPPPAAPTTPGVCGPDVAAPVGAAIAAMNSAWSGWNATQREEQCWALQNTDCGPVAWDIVELHNNAWIYQDYRPACATAGASPPCGSTVQAGSDCHFAGSMNYVVFGRQCALCDIWRTTMHAMIWAHKIHWSGLDADYDPAKNWADAGFDGWPGGAGPSGDRNNCAPTCATAYGPTANNTATDFAYHWAPNHSTETLGADCEAAIVSHRAAIARPPRPTRWR